MLAIAAAIAMNHSDETYKAALNATNNWNYVL
jgi:hypothetical protein